MIDLSAPSGLPLWLDAQREALVLAQPGAALRCEPQPLDLVRRVLLDSEAPAPEPLYWLFVQVALPTDEGVFDEHGVRHDVLMLRPGRVGREYTKTWGHIQICADGLQCPEAYGVLHGRAAFLLQELQEAPEQPSWPARLADVRWIQAEQGHKVVVPAAYGVVISNLGDEPLVVSRLGAAQAWPVHLTYERMQGAAYYVVEREGRPALEPNARYAPPLPPPREEAHLHAPELGVADETPLYSAYVHEPERFSWLREGVPAVAGVA